MTETYTDSGALVTWSTSQCPFEIEYSRKALDDIRLAVVDAFFSLPRGGAEIGGVLLGRYDNHLLQIVDYAPLECEHAFGPAFTLSAKDQARLTELLAEVKTRPGNLQPVGWYHSHTRSEIALCEADLDIHNRYFPAPWQVALVLQPSTLHPTKAGFFFREADDSIHASSSYREFVLEATPVRQLPAGVPEAVPGPIRETEPDAVVITLPSAGPAPVAEPPAAETTLPPARMPEADVKGPEEYRAQTRYEEPLMPVPVAETHVEMETHTEPSEPTDSPSHDFVYKAPAFEEAEAPSRHVQSWEEEAEAAKPAADSFRGTGDAEDRPKNPRRWMGIAAGVIVGLGLGVLADQARSHRIPQAVAPAPAQAARTDRQVAAPVIPAPEDAALRKQNQDLAKQMADLTLQNDGLRKQNATLLQQQSGAGKQQADISKQQAELRQNRDELAAQAAKLKADLSAQTARAISLQQQLEDLSRQQQRRRLSVQNADPLP